MLPKVVVVDDAPNGVKDELAPKLGVGLAPKLKPELPPPNGVVEVAGLEENPKEVVGVKLDVKLVAPNDGAVPVVEKELLPNIDPPPKLLAAGVAKDEVPKLLVPNEGVEVLPKEKGEVELPKVLELLPKLNAPPPPAGAPNGLLVPKVVVGVELKELNPDPNPEVVVGVGLVPKPPKEEPKGDVVFPNELVVVVAPKEKGLDVEPNMFPEPIAVPVPKVLEEPNGLELTAPKVLAEAPKGEACATAGAPP